MAAVGRGRGQLEEPARLWTHEERPPRDKEAWYRLEGCHYSMWA